MAAAITIVLTPCLWALNLFYEILVQSQALGFYVAIFFVFTVARLFIRPLVGSGKSNKPGED